MELLVGSQAGSAMNCFAVAAAACLLEVCATDGKNSRNTAVHSNAVLGTLLRRIREGSFLLAQALQYAVPQFPEFTNQEVLASEERQ